MFYLAVSIQMLPPQHGVPYAIVPVSKQVSKGFQSAFVFVFGPLRSCGPVPSFIDRASRGGI